MRQKPAMIHQPPSCSGTMGERPYLAAGGSSVRNGRSRMNWIGSQFTEAHMLSPITSMAVMPSTIEISPSQPR